MLLKSLRFVSVFCAAIVCGLTVAHVLEIPGKRQLTGPEWLAIQHTFYGGFGVLGGIGEIVGLVSATVAAVCLRRRRTAFLLHLAGVIGFLGMILIYALGNRPINSAIASWTASTLPADWPTYRDRWDAAHALSACLAIGTLVALLASAISDTRPGARLTERDSGADAGRLGAPVLGRPT